MPPSLATSTSNDPLRADSKLQQGFNSVKMRFEQSLPGFKLRVTTTERSREKQNEIFSQSRGAHTTLDGKTALSRHNYSPALAMDVQIIDATTGKLINPNTSTGKRVYETLGVLAEESGLVWGGRWKEPYDPYHLELDEPAPLTQDKPMDRAVKKFTRMSRGAKS
jgi:hypothetical protein